MNKYTPRVKQSWTQLDAIALLNGISTWDKDYKSLSYVRLPNETQVELRNKINRLHNTDAKDTSIQSLINGLSAELNLPTSIASRNNVFELTYFPAKRGLGSGPYDSDINVWKCIDITHPEINTNWVPIMTFTNPGTPVSGPNAITIIDYNDESWSKNILIDWIFETEPVYIKFEYWVKQYDEYNNPIYVRYTDVSTNISVDNDVTTDPWVFLPCTQPITDLLKLTCSQHNDYITTVPGVCPTCGNILIPKLNQLIAYSLNDMDLIQIGPDMFFPEMFWKITMPTGVTVASPFLFNIIDKLSKGDPKYKDISDNSTMWDINNDQLVIYDESAHLTEIATYIPLQTELLGGVEATRDTLYINDLVEDEDKNWKLICQSGSFFIAGKRYYLMNNPIVDQTGLCFPVSFINGIGTIPNQLTHIAIHKKFILLTENYNVTTNLNIVPDYTYPIIERNSSDANISHLQEYFENQKALRYSPIVVENGYTINFDTNEIRLHNIDFPGSTLPTTLYLVVDDIDVPGEVTLNYNINPVTNDKIQHLSYIISLWDKE